MASWKNLMNDTSLTIGCNNVFGQDPPKAYGGGGSGTGYPGLYLRCHRPLRLPQPNEKVLSYSKSGDRLLSMLGAADAARDPGGPPRYNPRFQRPALREAILYRACSSHVKRRMQPSITLLVKVLSVFWWIGMTCSASHLRDRPQLLSILGRLTSKPINFRAQ